MTERTVWCDKCGFEVTETDIEERCPYWECDGEAAMRVRDTGDALGQVLADALKVADCESGDSK